VILELFFLVLFEFSCVFKLSLYIFNILVPLSVYLVGMVLTLFDLLLESFNFSIIIFS